MVTVILLAVSTSVGSVITVISISDTTFTACPTTTNNATFISAIPASATTCYRKEESEGAGEDGREKGVYDAIATSRVNSNTKVSSRQESCKLLLCLVHVES